MPRWVASPGKPEDGGVIFTYFRLLLLGPVEDDASANEEIVLAIVNSVGDVRQVIVDLNDAQ
jgi:hypothetical protein